MAGPTYQVDPLSGDTVWIMEDGTQVPSSVEEATFGGFTYENGQLVDVSNPFNRTTLGQQGPTVIEQLPGQRFSLTSSVQRSSVNGPVTGERRYQFSGDITVLDMTGALHTIDMEGVNINRLGRQFAVHSREDGTEEIQSIPGRYSSTAQLQTDLGAEWRLATPTESIEQAARNWLIFEHGGQVEDIAAEGVEGHPETQGKFSETLRLLAQMLVSATIAYSHTIYEVT